MRSSRNELGLPVPVHKGVCLISEIHKVKRKRKLMSGLQGFYKVGCHLEQCSNPAIAFKLKP